MTIVGVAGIGKTRLALDVAAGLVESYPDGAWLCELAPIGEPDAVAESVAQVLGTNQSPGRSLAVSVAEFCRRRRLLLVLDNCEHVLDAAADLVEAVLAVAPSVEILTTSREGLGSGPEVTYPLASLETSGGASAAIELFLRKAAEAAPGREWNTAELGSIGEICARLDGIPLAIELAATRTRTQTPVEIEERLDEAFRSLRGGRRSVERHRTMQAAIDWSYATLSPPERTLFDCLAVFAGGSDLDAIEAVCADSQLDRSDILPVIEDLVSKSLVVAEPVSTGRTRYLLLEPLRQYAEDRLGAALDAEKLRDAHLDYYTNSAERWDEALYGPGRDLHISLELEFANARSALFWALAGNDVDRACRIVNGFHQAQESWRRLEVGSWAAQVLDVPASAQHPLGPNVAHVASVWCWWRNDLDARGRFVALAESMDHYDPTAYRHAHIRAAFTELDLGDRASARATLARAELRTIEDRVSEAWHTSQHDILTVEAVQASERLHELAAQTSSLLIQIRADAVSGLVQLGTDLPAAASSSRRAIEAAESIGARYSVHWPLCWLGVAAGSSGTVTASDLSRMSEGLRAQRDSGDETDEWMILAGAAVALHGFVGPKIASKVHRGLQTSPWSQSSMAGVVALSCQKSRPPHQSLRHRSSWSTWSTTSSRRSTDSSSTTPASEAGLRQTTHPGLLPLAPHHGQASLKEAPRRHTRHQHQHRRPQAYPNPKGAGRESPGPQRRSTDEALEGSK